MRQHRATPRRRVAPRWSAADWQIANYNLWLRQGGCCWWCGKPLHEDAARHHRMRRADGGDRYGNVLLLHSGCHNVQPGSVHQEVAAARDRGFIVPTWGDLLTAPVVLPDGRRWLLDDEAGKNLLRLP